MPCYRPLDAYQLVTGEIKFSARGSVGKTRAAADNPGKRVPAAADDIRRELSLPCGQCIGCRLERSRQWAVRCMHESQMHANSVFVTLTYDDEHCPISLEYAHFQKFMKRLRKSSFDPVRFYMAGEYGDQFGRPHFHACLFGCFFSDRKLYTNLPSGARLYTSDRLAQLWPYGFSSIGDVTFESAAYVARYVTKKVTGPRAEDHYRVVDADTGECFQREPEFNSMSLKPGIGFKWFEKFRKEVYPLDRVVIGGVEMRPPKYYDELLRRDNTTLIDHIEFERYADAIMRTAENSEARLRVREAVATARAKTFIRSLP